MATSAQESHYGESIDYTHGSPHLSDSRLRQDVDDLILGALADLAQRGLPMRVLEVGAGHGGFTQTALAAGAHVTALDMSRPSLDRLTARFGTNPNLTTVYSADGQLEDVGEDYTLLLCVSVLHHIPDYLSFTRDALGHLRAGASVLSVQDPLWYPRVPRHVHALDRAAYLTWRVPQGSLRQGAASFLRRRSGHLSDDKPGDLVEYHVIRQGVDERILVDLLAPRFDDVQIRTYWSNQLRWAHALGRRAGLANTFAVVAQGLRGSI